MKEKGPSEREGHRMQELSKEELMERVQLHRLSGSAEKRLDLQDIVLRDMDLSGADLKQIDFSRSSFLSCQAGSGQSLRQCAQQYMV